MTPEFRKLHGAHGNPPQLTLVVLMAVVRNAPEEQTRCRRVRVGSSDVSTVSWWSDIFTLLISGNVRGRCCGNFFSEKPEGHQLLRHKHDNCTRSPVNVSPVEKD